MEHIMKYIMKYIVGILKLAIVFSTYMFGIMSLVCKLLWKVDLSITVLLSLLIIITAFLVGCTVIYYVNKTIWNNIDTVHQNNDKNNIMIMVPNIKVIVDFIEYMAKLQD